MQDALKDIFGPMFEAMLQGEMNGHLGYESNDHGAKSTDNRRNGYTNKKVKTSAGEGEMVRRASENKIGRFNKQDIRELCPTLSDSSIEGALRKLVSDGELKKEGKGKSTCYFRLK